MVTDLQIRRLRRLDHQGLTKGQAAAKAGIDDKTARKYRRLGRLPSEVRMEHSWRTHGVRIFKSNVNHHLPLRISTKTRSSQPLRLRFPRTLPWPPCCFSSDKARRRNNAMFSAL